MQFVRVGISDMLLKSQLSVSCILTKSSIIFFVIEKMLTFVQSAWQFRLLGMSLIIVKMQETFS